MDETDQHNGRAEDFERLRAISRKGGLILLYHGVWAEPPSALAGGLHNVSPEQLAEQLEVIKQIFTIVTVDEFAQAKNRTGLAAVSFDDGYQCVIDEGLPVFESLEIPFTVYVNGSSFAGQTFWRDKVRFIADRNLTGEFEAQMNDIRVTGKGRFYRYTKDPVNNSRHVVDELDRFLQQQNLADELRLEHQYCFDAPGWLISHPLVTFGNHSQSHYVMASLSETEQREEILGTATLLDSVAGLNRSTLFSIPFGESRDYNAETAVAARDCGYTGMLLSRGRAHTEDLEKFGLPVFDRLMPRESAPGTGARGILGGLR